MSGDREDVIEHTLLLVREVHVYQIPPRSSSSGYKCAEWLVKDRIWSGRLRIVSVGDICEIRLEDPNSSELFAACPVQAGKREASVENVMDSSRYFVLRIEDGSGKHAFIGLGFNERNEAFDFNVAISDHEKHVLRARENNEEATEEEAGAPQAPALDLRLKEGEKIRINVKNKLPSSSGGKTLTIPRQGSTGSPVVAPLLPPPDENRIRKPLPPPPGSPWSSGTMGTIPPPPSDKSKTSSSPGWAAF